MATDRRQVCGLRRCLWQHSNITEPPESESEIPLYEIQAKNEHLVPIFMISGLKLSLMFLPEVDFFYEVTRAGTYKPEKMIFPGEGFIVSIKEGNEIHYSTNVTVKATGCTGEYETKHIDFIPEITDYNLILIRGQISQLIYSFQKPSEFPNAININWIGDIDGDKIPEFLFQIYEFGLIIW